MACNKFLSLAFSLKYIFGSDCHGTLNYMLILLTLYKLCAARAREWSTCKDTLYNVCSVHRGMFSTSGGCSVHRGDTMSTSGISRVHWGDIMSTSGDVQ